METTNGGTHLQFQHTGGWSRRITEFKDSLSYIDQDETEQCNETLFPKMWGEFLDNLWTGKRLTNTFWNPESVDKRTKKEKNPTIGKDKRQSGKIFAMFIANIGLVWLIYKEHLKEGNISLLGKWAKDMKSAQKKKFVAFALMKKILNLTHKKNANYKYTLIPCLPIWLAKLQKFEGTDCRRSQGSRCSPCHPWEGNSGNTASNSTGTVWPGNPIARN